jgi:hypothetical protein
VSQKDSRAAGRRLYRLPFQGFAIHNYAIVINGLAELRDEFKHGETRLLFRGHAQA